MKAMAFGVFASLVAGFAAAQETSHLRAAAQEMEGYKIIRCAGDGPAKYFPFKIGPDRALTAVHVEDGTNISTSEAGTVYITQNRVMVLSELQLTIVQNGKTRELACRDVSMELWLLLLDLDEGAS